MTTLLLTHPCFVEHDTGPGHPERPDRMRAIDKVLGARAVQRPEARGGAAPGRRGGGDRAGPSARLHRLGQERRGPRRRRARRRISTPIRCCRAKSWEPALRAVGAGLAAVDRVMDKGSGIANAFCPGAPVRPPCRARARHGLLHLQQRRHRRPLRAQEARRRARRRRRLRRAPRQRHAGHLLDRQEPVSSAPRTRCRSIPAPARSSETGVGNIWNAPLRPGRRRRPVQGGVRIAHPAGLAQLRARSGADLGRASMPTRTIRWPTCGWSSPISPGRQPRSPRSRPSMPRAGWCRCSKAATTSPRWRKSVGVHVKALMDAGA